MARRRRKKRRRSSAANDIVGRMMRAVIAILVLTAFVLAIAFSVKQLSSFDSDSFAKIAGPYLAKIGLGEEAAGEVAGKIFERVSDLGIEGLTNIAGGSTEAEEEGDSEEDSEETQSVSYEKLTPEGDVIVSIAILADSHIANDKQDYIDNKTHLTNALSKAKELNVFRAIHVGDITNLGVLSDLREAKDILDDSELTTNALPGDRDLAGSVNTDNFLKAFGKNKFSFEEQGTKFVLLDNSANYTLIPQETMDWFANEVKDADFVIVSQPLYTEGLAPFLNYLYMGSTGDEPANESFAEKQEAVLGQRNELLTLIRDSNVSAVIAGDHHKSSQLTDGERGSLEHYVTGAISGTVSEYAQSILQSQRFSLLKVYENGAFTVEDIILDQ